MRALGCEPKKAQRRVWKSAWRSRPALPEPGVLGWSLHEAPWLMPCAVLAAGSSLQRHPSARPCLARPPPPDGRPASRHLRHCPVAPPPAASPACAPPASAQLAARSTPFGRRT
jgi:hypothetical protein